MTPFEKRLSEIPFPEPPASWRREILAAAESRPRPWFLALLWPHPLAWAALAACWVLIAALNFSGPRGPELYAVTPPGTKPLEITTEQYAAFLRLRDMMLTQAGEPRQVIWELDPKKL